MEWSTWFLWPRWDRQNARLAVFLNPPATPAELQFDAGEHQRYLHALSVAYTLLLSEAASFVARDYKWESLPDVLEVIREAKHSEQFPITQHRWPPTVALSMFDRSGMTEPRQHVRDEWWEQVFHGVFTGQNSRTVVAAPEPGVMWFAPSWEGCAMVLWSCQNHAMLNGWRLSDHAIPMHQVHHAIPHPCCHSTFGIERLDAMIDCLEQARIGRERLHQEHVGTIHVYWEVSTKLDATESCFKEQLNTWFSIRPDRPIRKRERTLFIRFHCREYNTLLPTRRAALDVARREA